jgi:hypothetical protein
MKRTPIIIRETTLMNGKPNTKLYLANNMDFSPGKLALYSLFMRYHGSLRQHRRSSASDLQAQGLA